MKKLLLGLAKLIVLGFWLGAIYYTINPLPGKLHMLIPVFAVLVLMVHGIQAAIMRLVAGDLFKLTARHYLSLLLFGFFAMLELRDRLMQAAEHKPPHP